MHIPPSTQWFPSSWHGIAELPKLLSFFVFPLNLIPSLVVTKDIVNASSYALLHLRWGATVGQKISIFIPIDAVPVFATFARLWEAKDVGHAHLLASRHMVIYFLFISNSLKKHRAPY